MFVFVLFFFEFCEHVNEKCFFRSISLVTNISIDTNFFDFDNNDVLWDRRFGITSLKPCV